MKRIKKTLGAFRLHPFYHAEAITGVKNGYVGAYIVAIYDLAIKINLGCHPTDRPMTEFVPHVLHHFRNQVLTELRILKRSKWNNDRRRQLQRELIGNRITRGRMKQTMESK